MKLREKISLEEVCGQAFKIRLVETSDYGKAAFTHYMHNHQNGVSKFYKHEATQHVKRALEYKFPNEHISSQSAEETLQYILREFQKEVPFPAPSKPKFKFIDLFAGIGGFRIAMQNLT